jgi:hypothetical protein
MTVNIQAAIGLSPGWATRRTTRKSREGTQIRGGRSNLFSLFPFHFSRFLIETRKRLKIAVIPTKQSAQVISNRVRIAGHLVQAKSSAVKAATILGTCQYGNVIEPFHTNRRSLSSFGMTTFRQR